MKQNTNKLKSNTASKRLLNKYRDGVDFSTSYKKPFNVDDYMKVGAPAPITSVYGAADFDSNIKTSLFDNKGAGAAGSAVDAGGISLGGVASAAGGVGDLVSSFSGGDATSSSAKIGGVLSNAGKFASIGAPLGPIGMGVGAAVGGVVGLLGANKAARQQRAAEVQEDIDARMNANRNANISIAGKYNSRNFANNRVAGFDKGVAKFKSNGINSNDPNALIANGEGVMDGVTGRISTVDGTYNPNNPDVVPANLTEGSSVYSKNDKYIIPGGYSTPADIIARAEKMQTINDKILMPKEGQRKLAGLDKKTAELNRLNISKQAQLLNMNTMLNHQFQATASRTGNPPKYNTGDPSTTTEEELAVMEQTEKPKVRQKVSTDVLQAGTTNAVPKVDVTGVPEGDYVDIQVPVAKGQTIARQGVSFANKAALDKWGLNVNFGVKNGAVDEIMAGNWTGQMNKLDPNYKTGSSRGYPAKTYPLRIYKDQATKYATTPATTTTQSQIDPAYSLSNFGIGGGKQAPSTMTGFGATPAAPVVSPTATPNIDVSGVGGGNVLSSLSAMAPALNNMFSGPADRAKPVYEQYLNTNNRYNMAPALKDAEEQRRIAAYNNRSINTSTGAGMAFRSATPSINTLSDIQDRANTANIGYKNQYNAIANENIRANAAEQRRVDDLNARNQAAARNIKRAGISQMAEGIQVNQLMSNQRKDDMFKSLIFSRYNTAMSDADKASLDASIAKMYGGDNKINIGKLFKKKTGLKKPTNK